MKKSLGTKLCMAGIALISSFVCLNIILTYFFLIPLSTYLSADQMKELAVTLENRDDYEKESFMKYIEQVSEDSNTQITVIDGNKRIICTTRATYYKKKKVGPEVGRMFDSYYEEMQQGNETVETKSVEATNKIVVRVVKKIADDRYAILSRSYRSLQDATRAAILFDILSGIIIILVGLCIVYWSSRKLVVPIQKMTVIAEHISDLEFDEKVDVHSDDEIGQLGKSINKMSEHLEQNLEMLQDDIKSRKRLVRNLSHEIKSPVAVIMGYADRLKAVILKNPEKAIEYCEIISNESNRVDMLVKEMLELSRLEQQTEECHIENFLAEKLFCDIHDRFLMENAEKNIQYIESYDKKEQVKADYLLLERALYNLLNNAVAYGDSENMTIRVSGERNGEYYEFCVYNSGSFINEEDVSSIWEAFNKVDKVRTRGKQAGTGVGLSIVREIVEAHNGYYAVRNVEEGVEFLISVKG